MRRRFAISLLLAAAAYAQPSVRVDITVERFEGEQWKTQPSGLVFKKNDHLRFRVRSNFDGYLYVMNYGTSGQYSKLFPSAEAGIQNRIQSGVEYIVPATGASFRIDGPPGFDVVYWMISPVSFGDGSPAYTPLPPPPANPMPQNLKPRCDETILRARSLCIDSSAGPKSITQDEKLPENLAPIPRARSRDVVISSKGQSTSISSAERLEGPVLYKFLVAHE